MTLIWPMGKYRIISPEKLVKVRNSGKSCSRWTFTKEYFILLWWVIFNVHRPASYSRAKPILIVVIITIIMQQGKQIL